MHFFSLSSYLFKVDWELPLIRLFLSPCRLSTSLVEPVLRQHKYYLMQFGVNCLAQGQTSCAVNGDRTRDPPIQSRLPLPLSHRRHSPCNAYVTFRIMHTISSRLLQFDKRLTLNQSYYHCTNCNYFVEQGRGSWAIAKNQFILQVCNYEQPLMIKLNSIRLVVNAIINIIYYTGISRAAIYIQNHI